MEKTKILIVEDEGIVAKNIQATLTDLGYGISEIVSSGEAAVKKAEEIQPDLVLMDIKLKGRMDGVEAAEKIYDLLDIPIVYLTAYTDEATFKRAKITDPFGYILKPIEERGLYSTIEMALYKSHTQRILKERGHWVSTVLNSIGDAVVAIDKEGLVSYMNPVAETLLGWKLEEIKGKDLTEKINITINEEMNPPEKFLKKTDQKEETCFIKQGVIINRKGNRIPVDYSESALVDDKNNILGYVFVLRDITERKQTEAKIKEYSENLEHKVEERTQKLIHALSDVEETKNKIDGIIKSVTDGIVVTDTKNRIMLMNKAAEDLFGKSLSMVFGLPIEVVIKDKTLRKKFKSSFVKKETEVQFDFELSNKNSGNPRIMQARISVLHDTEGKDTGFVMILQDVTQEREVNRMKTEFISTTAHELRTPLTSIQGFSEVLLRDDLGEEEREKFLLYINKQAVCLGDIVSDLLDISRIESGLGFSLNRTQCDIGEVIKKVIPYFESQSRKHKFEIVLPDKPVELYGDKEKIEQILRNLIDNAIKYSPDGGVVCVVGKVDKNNYQVKVRDEGIGMTPEQIDKVFDKFFRVETSDTAPVGTGLGMTIVKYIVEAHGGKVLAESEIGKGTTVSLTIPIGSRQKMNKHG